MLRIGYRCLGFLLLFRHVCVYVAGVGSDAAHYWMATITVTVDVLRRDMALEAGGPSRPYVYIFVRDIICWC